LTNTPAGPDRDTSDSASRRKSSALRSGCLASPEKRDLEGLLEQAEVADLIQGSTSASEVEESKPDPDVVQSALQDAGFPAEDVVMIGDTPYDVEAAERAGVRIVGVRCGGWSDRDLAGAVVVYDDPADLLAHYQQSVFGADG
jgi:phosphoglycolate phosphatase-like HAD superfamily hydrolase